MPFAFIKFVNPRGTGYPDQGLPGDPAAPDQGLPESPAYPDQGLPGYGHPSHPIASPPAIWPFPPGPPRPWPPLPWPPRPWPPRPLPPWPPEATDPDWGIDAGFAPSQPIYLPIDPAHPDQGLPPVAGHLPAPTPPPGTVWPPLPGLPEGGYWVLVAVIGLGYRYVYVEVPPPVAGTPLPPTAEPK